MAAAPPRRILLASVLKPADDARMWEKFALSLAPHAEVHVTGRGNPPAFAPESATIHALPAQLSRWQRHRHIAGLLLRLRPDLLIIHSWELLPLALLARIRGAKVIYDVQENYPRNYCYQGYYRGASRLLLTALVQGLQWASRLWVSRYVLAERCYETEMRFHRGRSIILENKLASLAVCPMRPPRPAFTFALVGTLSAVYGIEQALRFWEQYQAAHPDARLLITGQVVDEAARQAVSRLDLSRAVLNVSELPIPHAEVLESMRSAAYVLLPYPPNPSTWGCIPSKLYECLALGIPMLIPHHPQWQALCQPHQAALSLNWADPDLSQLAADMANHQPYPQGPVAEALWQDEKQQLLALVNTVIGINGLPRLESRGN